MGDGARDAWDPCLLAAMVMGLGGQTPSPVLQVLGEAEPPNPTAIQTTGPARPRAALVKGIILGTSNSFFPSTLFLPVRELRNLTSSLISDCGASSFCSWDSLPVKGWWPPLPPLPLWLWGWEDQACKGLMLVTIN